MRRQRRKEEKKEGEEKEDEGGGGREKGRRGKEAGNLQRNPEQEEDEKGIADPSVRMDVAPPVETQDLFQWLQNDDGKRRTRAYMRNN